MTAADLQDLIVSTLAREVGTGRRWRLVVGPVKVYSLLTHPHCNWSVSPSGNPADVARVERLLDRLRIAHPVISA